MTTHILKNVLKCFISCFLFFYQELGYRGDIGYQTFLYSTEADIRKIFMFLVDKLPKESVEATEETIGKKSCNQQPNEIN